MRRKRRRKNGASREILVRGMIAAHRPYYIAKRTNMDCKKRVLCVHFAYPECGICVSFCYKEGIQGRKDYHACIGTPPLWAFSD
jgi:ferredoxin